MRALLLEYQNDNGEPQFDFELITESLDEKQQLLRAWKTDKANFSISSEELRQYAEDNNNIR